MTEPRWNVQPIVARPGGRIEALRLDLIPRDEPFGSLGDDE